MNPDGFELKKRGNANDIDLNRDFPDQVSIYSCKSTYLVCNFEGGLDFPPRTDHFENLNCHGMHSFFL